MSQRPQDLVSRKKLARNMRSKIRSDEYQKKRYRNAAYMWLSLVFAVGVPLLFYGGIEYGYFHKPTLSWFDTYSSAAWVVAFLTFTRTYERFRKYQDRDEQLLKLEMETLALDDDEVPQPQSA